MKPCNYSGCGRQPSRLHACGWRCPDHTPQALAGQPSPPAPPVDLPPPAPLRRPRSTVRLPRQGSRLHLVLTGLVEAWQRRHGGATSSELVAWLGTQRQKVPPDAVPALLDQLARYGLAARSGEWRQEMAVWAPAAGVPQALGKRMAARGTPLRGGTAPSP